MIYIRWVQTQGTRSSLSMGLYMALNPWLAIIIWATIIVLLTGPMLTLPIFWSRRKRDPFRDMPFESGQVPQGEARHRLVMQYYPFLLMFVVFDVVGMFLFAWGVSFTKLALDSSFLVILFIVLLAAPLGYALQLALKKENW
ncbi:MAG TPA: NADH-quinone oxidoreductase subunit A [Candidatus Bathyarchaeia archaeon]|nr:NADH-quinone oxidoreductase subunit A [Candidatus Bathyarchaeia archaeon]